MSNKIALATIQFRADAKGVNPALDAMRQSAKDAHDEINRMQEALNKGINTMTDANGVEFDVAKKLREATRAAKSFDEGLRELMRGATALESVVQNIRLGEIEHSSRAELKGAINAAESRKRSVRGDDADSLQIQRELNVVIEESRKQLNNLDRDTAKVIETIEKGGTITESTLNKEMKGLREILTLTEKGSDEWNKYNAQLQKIETHVADIRKQERESASSLLGSRDFGNYSDEQINAAINSGKELLSTYKSNNIEARQLAENIVRAQQYLKENGLEAARQAVRENEQIRQEGELYRMMNKRMRDLKDLSADALGETRKYWEAQRDGAAQGSKEFEKAEKNLKRIDNLTRSRNVSELDSILGDPKRYGISEVQNAVREMEKLRDSVQKGLPAWQHYNKMVNQGKAYLDNLAKTDAAQRINDQMQNLKTLSTSGLVEVKKYWQEQIYGATRGSQAYKDAEDALKRIANLEATRQAGQATRTLSNMGNYGDAEIRQAVQAMEQLRDAQAHGSSQWELYNKRVEEGKRYLDEWAQTDKVMKFEGQMQRLPQLSDAALTETRKFWETMVAGAEKGSTELAQYTANLEKAKQEERERQQINDEMAVQRLGGNLSNMSEKEISEAIEAGKRLIKTYETASPEAEQLAKRIADAEEHIKKYGLEAERAARKEAKAITDAAQKRKESDDLMKQQLQQSSALSKEALQNQEKYWKQLIDDPKTAASSLADYQQQLDKVHLLQQLMMEQNGQDALNFFRGDTSNVGADEIQRQAKALKLWRDSLPQRDNADLIAEIDRYLKKAGESAKNVEDQMMSVRQAHSIGLQAQGGTFKGTTQELTQAKKVLEDLQQRVEKGGRSWKKLEDDINAINREIKQTSYISADLQKVLDNPKGRSFNDLKQAIEQARQKLYSMDRTTEQGQKDFDELAKKIKEADREMKELGASAKGTATAFQKAWSRIKTYLTLYVGTAEAIQKLTASLSDVMELSDKMGEVRKTTGFTADEVGRLSDNLKKLDVRTNLVSLMEISASSGQLGMKTIEDVEGFTEAANKLMIALPEMGKEAATEMMRVAIATGEVDKIRKQLQEGTIEGSSATAVALEKIASTVDRLRASSASTAPEITDFVKRVGAVGAQSGISIDQIAALGSTVSSLGMRVEMSATALSRMIPAIKNNAFAIGNAIGVTETWIKQQFEAGRGMEVILKIFEHIRNVNMDADSVEKMFGTSMQDVMEELNQQGARAGIVFAGLSQGVDELRRQLNTASEAYEKNIAIQQEFEKMNETTAARWERLKNEIEEWFVGDQTQWLLGKLIDVLRVFADWFAADGPIAIGFKMLLAYAAAMKMQFGATFLGIGTGIRHMTTGIAAGVNVLATGLGTAINRLTGTTIALRGVRAATIGARREWIKMDAAMKANIIGAIITLIGALILKMWDLHRAAKESAAEVGRFNQKMADERRALSDLFEPLNKANLAQEERSKLISEINSKYGTYLGYMLSETASATQLADAHALIAKRIKEEAYERRIMEQERKVKESHNENINALYADIESAVRGGVRGGANVQEVTDLLKGVIDHRLNEVTLINYNSNIIDKALGKLWGTPDYIASGKIVTSINGSIERLVLDGKLSRDEVGAIKGALMAYAVEAKVQHNDIMNQTANVRSDLRGIQGSIKTELTNNLRGLVSNIASMGKQQQLTPVLQPGSQGPLAPFPWQPGGGQQQGYPGFNLFNFGQQQQPITAPLPSQMPKINEKNIDEVRQFVEAQDNLRTYLKEYAQNISESDRQAAEAWLVSESELERLRKLIPKGNGGGGGSNPHGDYSAVDSYDKWDANSLVDRKKKMLEYVKALANGADVQAVLAQDKKFMDEATRKGIKDVRQAIEWYNSERLKIQQELTDRHLTYEGQWANPSKAKNRKRQQVYSEEAVAELDRYYAWRKEEIEEARSNEEMTEVEYNRRLQTLEMEHLQKRSDLRKSFTSDDKDFIEQVWTWWKTVKELDQDIANEGRILINAEWKKATQRDKAYNDRDAQKDLTQMQSIIVKQLHEIDAIIDKERPFNGITRNLQDNLTKMELLFKDGVPEGDEFMKENTQRLTFLLQEAEQAYTLTWEQLEKDMRDKGLGAWADAIVGSDNADKEKRAIIAQLHEVYDAVQDAIKKEAAQVKKQVDIAWNDAILPNGQSIKATYEQAISALGIDQGRVSRANSLIGAGQASERVADKLAIKQMQIQLRMQEHYYNLVRQTGQQRIDDLLREAAIREKNEEYDEAEWLRQDAKHATMSLNLSLTKEQTELDKQREDIIARTEESQNRLYKELQEWANLLTSSVQSIFEAKNAGNAEYYNELAKLNLTGKGGPGAGTYIVIDDAGTSDAEAHYEYLDERAALERQHEIEQQNAVAEAWKKVMDDINQKMSETITDQLNAAAQNVSTDLNTNATEANTDALNGLTGAISSLSGNITMQNMQQAMRQSGEGNEPNQTIERIGYDDVTPVTATPAATTPVVDEQTSPFLPGVTPGVSWVLPDDVVAAEQEQLNQRVQMQQDAIDKVQRANDESFHKTQRTSTDTNKSLTTSTQSTFAKMTLAANMYGAAYQAMSNDNLSTTQKFEMMALQAVGNYAIGALTTEMAAASAKAATDSPGVLGTLWKQLGWAAAPVFAIFTGLLGGLMGMATSKIGKAKSTIAQATGSSVSAGRLATGMLTYAEGNVNEFTDPSSLTPGRQYNVDAADGKTYRARYMGKNAKTHITNGPEFHLVGEKGREAIIDAGTTRQITMNEPGIWQAIQTLYNGGSLRTVRKRGKGMPAFADGNIGDFEDVTMTDGTTAGGMSMEMAASLQSSIDRNSEVLERALRDGFKGVFNVYGKDGLVDSYDRGKKTLNRHGERY